MGQQREIVLLAIACLLIEKNGYQLFLFITAICWISSNMRIRRISKENYWITHKQNKAIMKNVEILLTS
jgi:hypothetical protein